MSVLILKLILTPLMMGLATLAARRWGPVVGGWIIGLPLTSGPVSIFLTIEQGPDFAAHAARASMLGAMAVITFCLAYTAASRRAGWPPAVLCALAGFVAAVAALSHVALPPVPSAALVFAFIGLALVLTPKNTDRPHHLPAFWWDTPLRMIAATAMVLLVTGLSAKLGPQLSGLFATFPVMICIMSVFSHILCGADAVRQLDRGIILGSFSFATFFLTVAESMPHLHPVPVYLLASMAAMGVNFAILFLARHGKADQR